jgi:hypothetical protein
LKGTGRRSHDLPSRVALSLFIGTAVAQPQATGTLVGRVTASDLRPISGALVLLESSPLTTRSDPAGSWRIARVPAGPVVVRVRHLGFAEARLELDLHADDTLRVDITLATVPLRLDRVRVTADARSRADGTIASATIIGRDAIENQVAASLAGVLELVPGVPIAPPGLAAAQQVSLRTVPANFVSGPGAQDVTALGTSIILDGVPLSNNANLQSLGARGELSLATNAGAGVDLRAIPAAMLERVEVIRGVPPARYGDLTQGAVIVDTRTAASPLELLARGDLRSTAATLRGGRQLRGDYVGAAFGDITRTRVSPGLNDDVSQRVALNVAVRGTNHRGGGGDARLQTTLVTQDSPEQPDVVPGRTSSSRTLTVRLLGRWRSAATDRSHLQATYSATVQRQRSVATAIKTSGATPFTDRLTPGRATGRYIGGAYLANVTLDGTPMLGYGRLEWLQPSAHRRLGAELRAEYNDGAGYNFAIDRPPQVLFNGIRGFDRPRRFDAVPPLLIGALYAEQSLQRRLGVLGQGELEFGARADALAPDAHAPMAVRQWLLSPRVNAQLVPTAWLRIRAAAGRTAKAPTMGSLWPATQWFDLVNVNWYANTPSERLAVLTTETRDPTSRRLGFSTMRKREVAAELTAVRVGTIEVVLFEEVTHGGVGLDRSTDAVYVNRYWLTNTTPGAGTPPGLVEPPYAVDTVPITIDRPGHVLDATSRGVEATINLRRIDALRLDVQLQGAWTHTRFSQRALEFGVGRSSFDAFQTDSRLRRIPVWSGYARDARRGILGARLAHHQPTAGLLISAILQCYVGERTFDVGRTDTLSWSGYLSRTGQYTAVPAADRADPAYADLRQPRRGLSTISDVRANDWIASLQLAKTVAGDGRLTVYAFNAFNREGKVATATRASRLFPTVQFGAELVLPFGWRGGFQ